MRKIIPLILLMCFLLVFSVFLTACGDETPETSGESKTTDTSFVPDSSTVPDTTTTKEDDLPMPTTNVYPFEDGNYTVLLELCTDRTVRVQVSDKNGEYRPDDPEYYMVQKEVWDIVRHTKSEENGKTVIHSAKITEPKEAEISQDNAANLPVIKDGVLYELENAELFSMNTESLNVLKVDGEWKGYTGEGFVKPFKIAGDKLEFTANVTEQGSFSITLRVNCGKKNDSRYDSSNHTGGLYIDGVKVAELSIEVSEAWGDSAKNGIWQTYTYENIKLTEGVHTFAVVAEGSNPGNFNLDSLYFEKQNQTVDALKTVEAESATQLSGMTVSSDRKALTVNQDGAFAKYASLLADNKKTLTLRVKSTGGTLTVYETGVGDKILCTITLPENNSWQTVTINCKDTDADPSDIFFAFTAKDGVPPQTEIDWFYFAQ